MINFHDWILRRPQLRIFFRKNIKKTIYNIQNNILCYYLRMENPLKNLPESADSLKEIIFSLQAELSFYKAKYANLLEAIRLAKQQRCKQPNINFKKNVSG